MLVIDGTYLIYKSYYRAKKVKDLYTVENDEHYIKISRNMFLKSVAKIKNKFKATSLFIVFDAEGENFRHKLLPTYKSNRKEKPEELLEIKNEIYSFLTMHNFSFQIADDFEGDDLIASFVEKNPNKKIKIFTGDADLAALVNNDVTLLLEKKKKIQPITSENFHHFFPIPASKISEFKALQGDKSDFVKGVDGLFRSEVLHLLMEYKNMSDFFENGKTHYLYEKLNSQKEKININRKVTHLKKDCPINYNWDQLKISHIYIPDKLNEKINWNMPN